MTCTALRAGAIISPAPAGATAQERGDFLREAAIVLVSVAMVLTEPEIVCELMQILREGSDGEDVS
jgi:hypothetical protein